MYICVYMNSAEMPAKLICALLVYVAQLLGSQLEWDIARVTTQTFFQLSYFHISALHIIEFVLFHKT